MQEQLVNDVRVVFRDTIPARYGWELIGPMNRLTTALAERTEELQAEDPEAEDVFIPGREVVEIISETLSWDEMVTLVRGAVAEWDFEADLGADDCCDDLDMLKELFPIIVAARTVYHGVSLQGE